jgi:hypothetical protein
VPLVVELVDAAGVTSRATGEAAVRTTRPNGESCPPTCVNGIVQVRGDGSVVDVSPSMTPSRP